MIKITIDGFNFNIFPDEKYVICLNPPHRQMFLAVISIK